MFRGANSLSRVFTPPIQAFWRTKERVPSNLRIGGQEGSTEGGVEHDEGAEAARLHFAAGQQGPHRAVIAGAGGRLDVTRVAGQPGQLVQILRGGQ